MTTSPDIGVQLERMRAGQPGAADQLFALLYDDFKSHAHRLLRRGPQQTCCTTELVNDTWLRLHDRELAAETRAHFVNIAGRAMRQVLVDRARNRSADKRGEGEAALTLRAASNIAADEPFDVLGLDRVMTQLARVNGNLAELAQLHLFAGLDMTEIATLRGVSERTAFREWRTARMFLMKFISDAA